MNSPLPASLPPTVAWLGYGGLLPFIFLTLAIFVDDQHAPIYSSALIAYGAVILSFVGALHWGFAMTLSELNHESNHHRRNACFIWSVVPAMLAWPALLLSPILASILLITGFIVHLLQDTRLGTHARLPPWYLPLRFRLSLIACVCLAAAAMAKF
ncbi:MAG: DUF3429 domain-containing protein [Propionivibrio sp.]|uniref:DUF3429 domain-containing protein n=1 Tax=Propionivibrio sp. TaxID=2212460 RepID=UPI001A3809F1|nr:DUF3429 domain-containing protein [Propionivibrio sp.]MBL8413159.1 DUF3429 domain-containing protein [Propionivibrio sp.]